MKKIDYMKLSLVAAMLISPLVCHAADAAPSAAEVATTAEVSLNTVWVLLAAMLVFFMQPGFALCEAGFTRSKNTANILMKNFCDFMLGSVCFWLIGFGVMFGAGAFAGMPSFGDLSFFDTDGIGGYIFIGIFSSNKKDFITISFGYSKIFTFKI